MKEKIKIKHNTMSAHIQAQEASQWEDMVLQTHTGHFIGYSPPLEKKGELNLFVLFFLVDQMLNLGQNIKN